MKTCLILIAALGLFTFSYAQNIAGKLIFSHSVYPNDTIYALDNDGKNITLITLGCRPRMSHNGKLMAFSIAGPYSFNEGQNSNTWVRDLTLQQNNPVLLTDSSYTDYYDFSADDEQLIYAYGDNIYTANINRTDSFNFVTSYPGDRYDDDPSVRSSDSLVVYHDLGSGLYSMNYNGVNAQLIPNTIPGDLYPAWSADGKWIAFENDTNGGFNVQNIYKIRPDGTGRTQLTFFGYNDYVTHDPAWAEDMQSVFIIANVKDTMGVFQVSADGSGNYKLLHQFYDDYDVTNYWLGGSSNISPSVVPCDSMDPYFNYTSIGKNYNFTDESIMHGGSIVSWNWDFGDSLSSANTSDSANTTHVFSDTGTYYVCVRVVGKADTNYCVGVYCTNIAISTPTGINEPDFDNTISIFPNPTAGVFKVSCKTPIEQISIYDITGRKVSGEKYTGDLTRLPENLNSGIYFIHIKTPETVIAKRIMLNKME